MNRMLGKTRDIAVQVGGSIVAKGKRYCVRSVSNVRD